MKFLLTIFFSFIVVTTACAGESKNKIIIGSNAKTSKLEIKYQSNYRKNFPANVVIFNAEGQEVRSFKCELSKGANSICMEDALKLKEGMYTVVLKMKHKKCSTKFMLFK